MIGILAEKPSQARNFAKALGGSKGSYNGEQFVICAARGHLFEFAKPEEQVPEYRSWDMKNLPWDETRFNWKRARKRDVSSALNAIKTALKGCDEICIATDDDPTGEGELIAWEVFDELNLHRGKKVTRMYFTDESVPEVQKAFKNRKVIPSMMQDMDYVKAMYRSQWDFLSMQFTRIATSCGDGHSVLRQGRLKSAMVLLVGDQLKAVSEYKAVPFYTNKFRDENDNVYSSPKEPSYKGKADVPNVYGPSPVVLDGKAMKCSAPPKLIDLATLSAKLASKHGAKVVLATYQKMYEAQVVSYPRTEDKFITPEQFNDLLPKVDAIASLVGVDRGLLTHRSPRKTHVKTGCAHGANRPGPNVPKSMSDLDKFGPAARDIYMILAKNYLSMLAEDYEYEQQKGHLEKYPDFTGTANVPVKQGWHAVAYDAEDDDDGSDVSRGLGRLANPFVHEGFPPKPQAPTMRWLMKQLEQHDVGTGATRTSTYADVTNASGKFPLLKDTKGKISMSRYGEMSYMLLPGTNIGNIKMTEQVMREMRDIADGKADPADCLRKVRQYVREDIVTMTENGKKMRKEMGVMLSSEKEYCEGAWNGKNVKFNRVFCGHRFTDEECEALLAGEEIEVLGLKAKNGSEYGVVGKLSNLEYNGRKYVGFERIGFAGRSNSGPREGYASGKWKGRDVQFKREWGGHVFTDAEVADLLAGKTIEIENMKARSGSTYTARGALAEQEYNGHKYIGFKLDTGGVPKSFCGHKFTQDEIDALEAGTTIFVEGLMSKKGNVFSCNMKYGEKDDGSKGIILLFDN